MSIHILDRYTDKIKDYLTNKPDKKIIIEDLHTRNIESHSETYDFTVDYAATENIQSRDRVLIPDEEIGQYREFVVDEIETDTYDGETEIKTVASYLEDLEKARPIEPNTIEQYTTQQAVEYALTYVDWEVGTVEYGGFRTISWTGVNSPYELLKIIANRFDLQLDFTIEIDGNEISKRLVHLREKTALFDGKEVRRGKDLENLQIKRTSTDVVTALLALAPEPEEGKERITATVVDDEAQAQYGREQDYIWGVYEPESDDTGMTKKRLETLARTQLNKLKNPKTDYTIDAVDLEEFLGHEKVRIGDKIKIKDDLQEPYFYADATVKEVKRSIFDPLSKSYVLGDVTEYTKMDITKIFQKFRDLLSKKMAETNSNIDNIVEIIDTEVERRIWKQPTPPENPTNGQWWLDTSNPDKPILKEYYNGVWVERISAVKDPEDIGAISREQALYESILSSLQNFEVLHMQLLTEANIITTNKYLNQTNIDNINEKLQMLINTYNQLKAEVNKHNDSKRITLEQANYIHQLMLNYSNAVKALQEAIVTAQNYAMEHLAILQAQYTDEKFTEAIEVTAERLGFIVEDDVIKLSPDSPVSGVIEALRQDTEEQFKSVVKQVDYDADKQGIVGRLDSADSERTQLSNEIKDRVTLTDYSKDKTAQTGRISTLETSVTQNGQAITLKASQDDLDSVERTLSTKQAQLEVKADGIESNVKGLSDDLKLANTKIEQKADEIELGVDKRLHQPSRNLIPHTVLPEEKEHWSTWRPSVNALPTTTYYDNWLWVNDNDSAGGLSVSALSPILTTDIVEGRPYTLSFKTVQEQNVRLDFNYLYVINPNGSNYSIPTEDVKREVIGAEFNNLPIHLHTVTVRPNFSGKAQILIGTNKISSGNGRFYLKEPQFETGEVANSYRPADTDLLDSYAQLKITTNDITSEVGKKVGNDEIISRINQSAEKVSIDADKINLTAGSSIDLAIQNTAHPNPNIIPMSNFWSYPSDDFYYNHTLSVVNTSQSGLFTSPTFGRGWVKLMNSTLDSSSGLTYMWTQNGGRNRFSITAGQEYTFSILVAQNYHGNDLNYCYIREVTGGSSQINLATASGVKRTKFLVGRTYGRPVYKYIFTFTPNFGGSNTYMFFGMSNRVESRAGYYLSEWKLEAGDQASPYNENYASKDHIISAINADTSGVMISGDKVSISANDISIDGKTINISANPAITSLKTSVGNAQSTASSALSDASDADSRARAARTQADAARVGNNIAASLNLSGTTTTISGSKIDLVGDVSMVNGNVKVRQLSATSGGNTLTMNGNTLTMDGNTGTLTMGNDGITYRNSGGGIRYEMNENFVRSSTFGTTTANIYLAASNGYEVRFVDIRDVPGAGSVNDYRYIDTRAHTMYAKGVSNNSKHSSNLDLGADGYVRIMNNGHTTLNTLWAAGIRTDFVDLNASGNSSNHMYIRTRDEVRITKNGTTSEYMGVRGHNLYFNNLYTNTATHLYLRTDGEVRVAAHGSGTFRDIRASGFLPPSSEKYKTEITGWNYSVLNIIKNETKLYRYKLTGDDQPLFRHGLILERETPVEMKAGDGIDLYEMNSWTLKGVQELAHENDELKAKNEELEERLEKLEQILLK